MVIVCHVSRTLSCRERSDGERERDGEPDETQVEKRRVERDERVVLQQHVRTEPVGRDGARDGLERVGGTRHEREEERRDAEQDEHGPADERVADADRLKRTATAPIYPDRIRPHRRMDPASADHIPVIV